MNNSLCVAGVGTVAVSTIKIRDDGKAVFTLRSQNNRFYVVTTGFEQMRVVSAMKNDTNVMLLGSLYTFRGKCGQHHVAIEPQVIIPLNNLERQNTAVNLLHEIVLQWSTGMVAHQLGR